MSWPQAFTAVAPMFFAFATAALASVLAYLKSADAAAKLEAERRAARAEGVMAGAAAALAGRAGAAPEPPAGPGER